MHNSILTRKMFGVFVIAIMFLFSCKSDEDDPISSPEVTTQEVSEISNNSVKASGSATGEDIVLRGFAYGENQNPTFDDNTAISGSGEGSFTSTIENLDPSTTYFVRAAATNSSGITYGEQKSFTTLPDLPVLSILEVSNITSNSVTGSANVTGDGITDRGMVYGLMTSPTIAGDKSSSGTGEGDFTVALTGLIEETTYFARAYATNSSGTEYGDEVTFMTLAPLPTLATVTTDAISEVTSNTATGGGNITSSGNLDITQHGIVWGISTEPTINLSTKTQQGAGSNEFVSSMTGLTSSTEYFVRAYATNSEGTAYGDEVIFETLAPTLSAPTVTTEEISDITSSSAIGGGEVTSDGNTTITVRGVVWSTTNEPTIDLSTKTTDGASVGIFTSLIDGLSPTTTYFVRAYAINSQGTAYGNETSFTTTEIEVTLPTVTTAIVTVISHEGATGGGDVTSDGNGAVTARGIVWSTSSDPTIDLSTKTSNGTGTGVFTSDISGLNPSTQYFVRAYATNSAGTAYGSELSFTTEAVIELATITTASISSTTSITASSGGDVTSNGGGTITARGVVWGTSTSPDISLMTKTTDGTGTGTFTSAITGLSPSTEYFVRAYATNSAGTAYGDELTFLTLSPPVLPTITTAAITNINSTIATGGGEVTSDGNAEVTARGIVWSQTANPTISSSGKTTDGTGTGSFTSSLSALTAEVTYFVRAYATNSEGTAYGSEVSFTTYPTLAANEVYNPITGKIWMDRNLGATQVATNSTNGSSYGDLYQWGRNTDGHQLRVSGTTTTLSSTDVPGHGNFIVNINFPGDWRSPQNDAMWTSTGGTNNVCPAGYRIPSSSEWIAERESWSSNNAAGAFGSPLKLPLAGNRSLEGVLQNTGNNGNGQYWSSSLIDPNTSDKKVYYVNFWDADAADGSDPRGHAKSVRCIKN